MPANKPFAVSLREFGPCQAGGSAQFTHGAFRYPVEIFIGYVIVLLRNILRANDPRPAHFYGSAVLRPGDPLPVPATIMVIKVLLRQIIYRGFVLAGIHQLRGCIRTTVHAASDNRVRILR